MELTDMFRENPDILSHHSYTISSLAQNNRTHRIQTLLSHLQSSHNHLHICINSSLFNLLTALALHLWLSSLDHQHHPRYISLIAALGMPHHVSEINFLVLSVNPIPFSLSLTCLFLLLSYLFTLSTHHSHHP